MSSDAAQPSSAQHDLAVFLQFLERAHRFVERRLKVGPVDQHQIDHVGAQPPQATLGTRDDVFVAGLASGDLIFLVVEVEAGLGDQDNLPAACAERLAEELFRVEGAVYLGGVEQVDAVVDRTGVSVMRPCGSARLPQAVLAPGCAEPIHRGQGYWARRTLARHTPMPPMPIVVHRRILAGSGSHRHTGAGWRYRAHGHYPHGYRGRAVADRPVRSPGA